MLSLTSNNFALEIEELCQTKNIEYIDAVVHWCEKNKIEIEYAANLIKKDPVFKSKIQVEAENINVLKKSARLPL
jgi:hypothetical protein